MKRGVFITFEGPEGGGKSTHIRKLSDWLGARGIKVVTTREPGGTKLGEAIRGILQHDTAGDIVYPETEALLFAASRAHLVRSVILPALKKGKWVLCDRYADSTTAYQSFARGLDRKLIDSMNSFAMGEAVPDLTLLLDLDVKEGFKRVSGRSGKKDRIERAGLQFHRKVRNGYLALAKQFPGRFATVDASGSVEEVDAAICEIVRGRFLRGRGGK